MNLVEVELVVLGNGLAEVVGLGGGRHAQRPLVAVSDEHRDSDTWQGELRAHEKWAFHKHGA